jgi:hypothetical protein
LTAARKQEAEWKETADSWEKAPTHSVVGWDVPADDPRRGDWQASDSKLLTTAHAVSRGWPSVEGGIEVSVEVCSNAGNLAEERTACRCSCIRTDLSFQPIDRKRSDEEGEEWLAREARRRSVILERVHWNREDDSF